MLLHISADTELSEQIRKEIGQHAGARQPPQTLHFAEPPRLELDIDGLVKSCPLLKACFHECIRLYTTPTSIRSVTKSIEVQDSSESNMKSRQQAYVLEAGKFVAAPMSLHHHDPEIFNSPEEFQPSRFLLQSGSAKGREIVDGDKVKPWGVGAFACPGRLHAERTILALMAGILALWDLEPVDRKAWSIPERRERAVTSVPSKDIRFRIQMRSLSP